MKTALEFINHHRASNAPFQRALDPAVAGWSAGDVAAEARRLGWSGGVRPVLQWHQLTVGVAKGLVGKTFEVRGKLPTPGLTVSATEYDGRLQLKSGHDLRTDGRWWVREVA